MNNLFGRAVADLNRELFLEQQRTQALTERLAQVEGDIERLQLMIGRLHGSSPAISQGLGLQLLHNISQVPW